jgi:hypothetical protein
MTIQAFFRRVRLFQAQSLADGAAAWLEQHAVCARMRIEM